MRCAFTRRLRCTNQPSCISSQFEHRLPDDVQPESIHQNLAIASSCELLGILLIALRDVEAG